VSGDRDHLDGVEIEEPGIFESIGRHAGTLINAAAFIVVVFLVAFFGLRPLASSLVKPVEALAAPSFEEVQRSLPTPQSADAEAVTAEGVSRPTNPLDDLRRKIRPAPQERLARMVDLNEERTALILRKWAHEEVAA
jgi:flagellar M-ring protein FliF